MREGARGGRPGLLLAGVRCPHGREAGRLGWAKARLGWAGPWRGGAAHPWGGCVGRIARDGPDWIPRDLALGFLPAARAGVSRSRGRPELPCLGVAVPVAWLWRWRGVCVLWSGRVSFPAWACGVRRGQAVCGSSLDAVAAVLSPSSIDARRQWPLASWCQSPWWGEAECFGWEGR